MRNIKRNIRTFSLPADQTLLVKHLCLRKADRILEEGRIAFMTREEIAKELFFHAALFYWCKWLARFGIHLNWIMRHADPIDLADHGDTPFRKFCFSVLWVLPVGRKEP